MQPAKYTALQIAKYFILKAKRETQDKELTPLKLQKILYYAQGWYLANYGKPLFTDDIQAWKFGPAIYAIYKEYEKYANTEITEEVSESDISVIDSNDQKFLDVVYDAYKQYSATDLINSTHSEKPWRLTRNGIKSGDSSESIISLQVIKDYFTELMKR